MESYKLKIDSTALAANIRAAQKGDEQAFSWLISQTKERLLRFLFFLAGDFATAQDICQETYLYAMEHLPQLKEPEAFPSWLFLIGKNRYLDFKKSPRNQRHMDLESGEKSGGFAVGRDQELWIAIQTTLEALRHEEREVILLIDLEGYSYAEAAEHLKLTEAAVTSRITRARAAFHKLYFKN